MSFKKFCPKCGKETERLVGKVCVNCFLKNKKIFEINKFTISICKYCNKLFVSGQEIPFNEEVIAEEIASQVKIHNELEKPKVFVELEKKSDLDYEALVQVKGFLSNQLIEQEKVIQFRLKETTCESCMKLNSDYREAIIQLRANNKRDSLAMFKLTKSLLDKEKAKDSLSGTSKIMDVKNGYDLWIGSKKAAAKISRELSKIYKVKIIKSKKLIGEDKSGVRKYRHTFCIKLE